MPSTRALLPILEEEELLFPLLPSLSLTPSVNLSIFFIPPYFRTFPFTQSISSPLNPRPPNPPALPPSHPVLSLSLSLSSSLSLSLPHSISISISLCPSLPACLSFSLSHSLSFSFSLLLSLVIFFSLPPSPSSLLRTIAPTQIRLFQKIHDPVDRARFAAAVLRYQCLPVIQTKCKHFCSLGL